MICVAYSSDVVRLVISISPAIDTPVKVVDLRLFGFTIKEMQKMHWKQWMAGCWMAENCESKWHAMVDQRHRKRAVEEIEEAGIEEPVAGTASVAALATEVVVIEAIPAVVALLQDLVPGQYDHDQHVRNHQLRRTWAAATAATAQLVEAEAFHAHAVVTKDYHDRLWIPPKKLICHLMEFTNCWGQWFRLSSKLQSEMKEREREKEGVKCDRERKRGREKSGR